MNPKHSSILLAVGLCAAVMPLSAELKILLDEDFASGRAPAGFIQHGNPTYMDGRVRLDGIDDYLQIASPLSAAQNDNFVLEFIAEPESLPRIAQQFAILGSISGTDGTVVPEQPGNNGFAISLQQGAWKALTSTVGFSGSVNYAQVPEGLVAVAYVRDGGQNALYINGRKYSSSSPRAQRGYTLRGSKIVLTLGGHSYDAPKGLFKGAINHVRLSTFAPGSFDSTQLLTTERARIPEPAAYGLLIGLLTLGWAMCRRPRKQVMCQVIHFHV